MAKPITFETAGWEDSNTTFRAYIEDDSTGTAILAAAVSAIAYSVTQSLGPSQSDVTGSGSLSPVATYITNVSLTGWLVDNVGYNFKATLPAACFPEAGHYVVDFLFTLSDGSTFPVKCFHTAKSRS